MLTLLDFKPALVFDRYYREHLLRISDSNVGACERIAVSFTRMALEIENKNASEQRSRQLASLAHHWALLKTISTCLFCLCHKPEHILACGHAICEDCVYIFGIRRMGYDYCLPTCALCLAKTDFFLRRKPPTAKPRMLSVDGVGSRV